MQLIVSDISFSHVREINKKCQVTTFQKFASDKSVTIHFFNSKTSTVIESENVPSEIMTWTLVDFWLGTDYKSPSLKKTQ